MDAPLSIQCQETVSSIALIDKLIKQGVCARDIVFCINHCFSKIQITEQTVQNRFETIQLYRKQLDKLLTIPKIDQRTSEWYNVRKSLITASDFAQALGEGKFGTQKQLFQKKCGFVEDDFTKLSNNPALKWGVMFEPVAQQIYSERTGYYVHEFGLIKHPSRSYFGASPDGITDYGIMLEIKCPFKRKITGEIPQQYYYQIQGQLDVCGLQECDYLECEFEVDNNNPYPINYNNYETGAIVEYENDYKYFKYNDLNKTVLKPGYINIHYWRLVKYNVVRVLKDEDFVNTKLDDLKEVWDKIEYYQSNKNVYDKEISTNNNQQKLTGYSFI